MQKLTCKKDGGAYVSGVALATLALSTMVTAQETTRSGLVLEEITVTAQKRNENLQEVPMAVSAFSTADIDRRAIRSMADLDAAVPGLTIADNGLFDKVPTIRGVGNEAQRNRATTASVAYHMDGVFLGSTAASMQDYLDVERIEVLRGPQGTVFGQNATGGVINVITRQPELDNLGGYVDAQVGSYDLIRVRANANVPLGRTVAARASVQYLQHDSFTKNVTLPNAKLDDADNLAARVQFLWQPSDTFSATLRAQYFDTDTGDRAQKNVLDPTPDPRKLRQDYPATFEFDSQIFSAELRWNWDWATLKSISSYQDDTTVHRRDGDRSDGFYLPRMDGPFQNANTRTITQELNLASSTNRDSRFDWLIGSFFYDYRYFVDSIEFLDRNGDNLINPDIFGPERSFTSRNTFTRDTWSLFAESTYHVTDVFRITAGFRYSQDDFKSVGLPFPYVGVTPRIVETDEDRVTGRVNLQWDVLENSMIYGGWSSGWKPGTSNLTFGGLTSQIVGSTIVDAYEVGMKNVFFGGRLQMNIAAYYYDFEGVQFFNEDVVPGRGAVDTLPKTTVKGIDLEISALLTDNLRLDLNYSYNDGKIDSDKLALDRAAYQTAQQELLAQGFSQTSPEVLAVRAAAVQNVRGNSLPKAPKNILNLVLSHELGIGSFGTLTSSVMYQYKDGYPFLVFNNPSDQVPSYDLINLNFLYKPQKGNWAAEFGVINLADDDAIQSLNTDIFGVGATAAILVPPRQYQIRLSYEF